MLADYGNFLGNGLTGTLISILALVVVIAAPTVPWLAQRVTRRRFRYSIDAGA
jgi:predicted MFS family arabinose efflux permease